VGSLPQQVARSCQQVLLTMLPVVLVMCAHYKPHICTPHRPPTPNFLTPAGTLPPTWSRLTTLRNLRVSANQFSGPLPPSWVALTKLRVCYLYDNRLSGPLPSVWSGMAALEQLDLSNRTLTGGARAGGGGRCSTGSCRVSHSLPMRHANGQKVF
jgi:hypothetical protein